jgi:hypothetical protein
MRKGVVTLCKGKNVRDAVFKERKEIASNRDIVLAVQIVHFVLNFNC